MSHRDLKAALTGAGLALTLLAGLALAPSFLAPDARAQDPSEPESLRFLVLALANAIASVAVDGERTAIALNDSTDELRAMKERVDQLERRLATLEKK